MIDVDYYLFIYDIGNPKIIAKIVKRLNQINSMRIQKSVFEIQCNKKEIMMFITDVCKLINHNTDKIALIPICSHDYSEIEFYGLLSRHPVEVPSSIIL